MSTSFVRLETCVFLAAFILGARARAEDVLVLFTADNAGSVGPCPACPERTGEGGLARRATAVSEARSTSPGLFLLDAGDAFHGPESIESHGKVIVAAYNALAYDAVNLTFRDFRGGKAAALALLEDAGFAVVSANLLDSATGSPLAKPFVVLGAGDRKIAVIGLSELSAGQEHLPHLKTQLEGVRVRHPVEALREWLPAAGQAAPRVILLYHGSRTGLGAVLDELGDALSAVIVGGLRPEHVPGAARPGLAVVGTADRGRQIGRVSLGGPQGSAARALDPIPVKTTLTPDSGIEALAASFRSPVKEIADVPAGDARSPAPAGSSPAEMEAGRTYRLDLRAENRGASLTVLSAVFLSTYGNLESGAGRKLLLLDTEWENIIPLTVVEVEKVPTEYRIPNLADHLYLVVNGSRLERLLPEAGTIAGHLPVRDFRLERIGSRIRANVIFSVPADGVESLDLRFYDYAHGHIAMALRSRDAGMEPAAKPVAPPQRNEVLEAAVYGLEKLGDLDGRAAPAGMEFLAVDFRARSLFLVDGDATAFDPKARPGARRMIGTVADWLESRKYVQLLADGEIAYSPLPESTLA
ncbi:MAG TPA: hypothetical protein VMT52_17045, partial [Planctomycetota bacterium]|nr:hypothetical protein [Planctomycetota bacterium]